MAVVITIKRGLLSALPSLANAEPGYSTDQARLYIGNTSFGNTLLSVLKKINGTTAPTVNDDSADSYSVGSVWTDTTNDKSYICSDSTVGAAVWQQISGSGTGGITQLTGNVTAGPGTGSQVATIAASAVTLAMLANIADQTILGNNTGGAAAPVALTASQTRTVLGLATGDSPQFAAVNLSDATANTLTGSSGDAFIEGNLLYRAGGTDVPIADGGTGASTAALGFAALAATSVAFQGDISPSQITADQNNYNPAGLSTASVLRLYSDATRGISGLQGGADGRIIIIQNIGSFIITLESENASSSAANRFALPYGRAKLHGGDCCVLQYDSISSRWRCVGFSAINALESSNNLSDVETPATALTNLGGTTVGISYFTLTNPSAITFPRMNADNTVSALDAATFRTAIGATTVGGNVFTVTNPSAIRFLRVNADNTVTLLSDSDFRTAIGAGTGSGTVTSVATAGLATGGTITGTGTITVTAADQSAMETGTATDKAVTPGVVVYHPGVAKAWARWDASSGTPTNVSNFGVTSYTDGGAGITTVNLTTAMSGTTVACWTGTATGILLDNGATTTTAIPTICYNSSFVAFDSARNHVHVMGDR